MWLLAAIHRPLKDVKYGIRYIAGFFFYIMECREANVLFEAAVNCVIQAESSCCQDFYSTNTVIMRIMCLWMCIHGERAELNLYFGLGKNLLERSTFEYCCGNLT